MRKLFKSGGLIRLIAALLLILTLVLLVLEGLREWAPQLASMLMSGDRQGIEDTVRSFGSFGGLMLMMFLQFAQIISVLLPCTPVQLAAGGVFGVLWGSLACHIGYLAANMTVFSLARRLGDRFDRTPDRKLGRIEKLSAAAPPVVVVFMACLLPIMPNGLVPYFAARTPLSLREYSLSVAAGSLPGIICWCAVGSSVLKGNYILAACLGGGLLVVLGIMYWQKNRLIDMIGRLRK